MIKLIKGLIFLIGLAAAGYLVMIYLGYRINTEYLTSGQQICAERVQKCKQQFFEQGAESGNCRFDCLQQKLFIKN